MCIPDMCINGEIVVLITDRYVPIGIIITYRPTVSQLDKCLKFTAFRGVILYSVQLILLPQQNLNFRRLSSFDTVSLHLLKPQLMGLWLAKITF